MIRVLLWLLLTAPVLASTISNVRLEGAPPHLTERLTELLPLQSGDELDAGRVKDTVRLLMLSGVLSDVRVEFDDGDLIIRVRPKISLESIHVSGFRRSRVLKLLKLRKGEWYWPDELIEVPREELLEYVKREGFIGAKVELELTDGKNEWQKKLKIKIDKGPLFPVGEVRVEGICPDSPRKVIYDLMGEPFRLNRWDKQLAGIKRDLYKKGFLEGEVSLKEYKQAGDHVDLVVKLDCGRPVTYEFKGDKLSYVFRQKIKHLLMRSGFKESAIRNMMGEYKEKLHKKGYFRAQLTLSSVEDETCGCTRLIFFLFKGEKYKLEGVSFTGNDTFSDEMLRSISGLKSGGRITEKMASTVRDYLENYYVEKGLMNVAVEPPSHTFSKERRSVAYTFTIDEGDAFRVGTVHLEGFPEPVDEFRDLLQVKSGEPMREDQAGRDVSSLLNRLNNRGYADALVTLDTQRHNSEIDLTFRCQSGPVHSIGKVFYRGLNRVRPDALEYEMKLKSGMLLSRSDLFNTQDELYSTGLFGRVEIQTIPASGEKKRDHVLIDVEENRSNTFYYGIGYDTEDKFRLQLGYTMANLFGRRHYFGLTSRLSDREKHYRLTYRLPHSLRTPYPLSFVLYRTDEKWVNFDLRKENFFVEYSRQWGVLGRGFFRLEYSEQKPEEMKSYLEEAGEGGLRKIFYPVASYVYDTRPDPVFPLKGQFFSAELRWAPSLSFTDSTFLKAFIHQATYLPVASRRTLVLSFRLGGIEPLDDTSIPLGERFFAGGRTSHRAYGRDGLGINGETLVDFEPVGGRGVFLGNLELRSLITKEIGYSVFLDIGNVFEDYRDIDPERFKTGVGVGLFLLTPVGPIRVEYGRKLDPEKGESEDQWFMSLGFPF